MKFFSLLHPVLCTDIFCRVLTAVFKGDWVVIFFAVLFLADFSIKHMFALWEELGRFLYFIGCGAVLGWDRHFLFLRCWESSPAWYHGGVERSGGGVWIIVSVLSALAVQVVSLFLSQFLLSVFS